MTNAYRLASAPEILPTGWLYKQLRLQADGLAGNLDKIWPDVRDSAWIGGDREGWERVPYWLDGFLPLAYLLRDDDLIARAKKYIEAVLAGQREDGWICPCADDARGGYDMWALLLITKVLTVYAECDPDDAARADDACLRALKQAKTHFAEYPLFSWGQYRWFEGLIAVERQYRRTGEEWLVELADLLHEQGRDYNGLVDGFEALKLHEPVAQWQWDTHIVNWSMAIKADALYRAVKGVPADECGVNSRKLRDTLTKWHGMPCGAFTGDECLAGRGPSQGTELCGVVEAMYSYEWLLAITGDAFWGDCLEQLAFNALPAACTPDMWAHQYDQQTNQIACAPESDASRPFMTNRTDAGVFGLEPNYGCCTANFGQGWPKLALSAFMASDDTIFCATPLPAAFTTEIGGVTVTVQCDTAYPFGDGAVYTVSCDRPVSFALDIRIPGTAATASINGAPVKPGSVVTLDGEWRDGATIELAMTFRVRLDKAGFGDLRVVRRGPLLFSLPILCRDQQVEYTRDGVDRKAPYCDHYLYPAEDWGWGFAGSSVRVLRDEDWEVSPVVFGDENVPVAIELPMAPVCWNKKDGMAFHAADLPQSAKAIGPVERRMLIPYGCTMLRMTAMPKCAE